MKKLSEKLSLVFFVFILIMISVIFYSYFFEQNENNNTKDIIWLEPENIYLPEPIKVKIGNDHNITINATLEQFDKIFLSVDFDIPNPNIIDKKVVWVIDNKFMSEDINYHHNYKFNETYYPLNSTIELKVYEENNIKSYKSILTYNFVENPKYPKKY